MRRLAVLALLLPAAIPGTAGAATVAEEPSGDVYLSGPTVVFRAAPGEVNAVTLTAVQATGVVTIQDPGVPVTPGAGCHAVDPHTVSCGADAMGASPSAAGIELGAGADSARL